MTLQQIKYFICAAEAGSISEAAKRMYVAQSSVSSAIKDLENYYGIQLFQRSAKGVILTGAGAELLHELQAIDKKMDFLKNKYNDSEKQNVTFSVAALHHVFALEPFTSIAKQLSEEKYKQYKICFLECCSSEILEHVERGYADIGVLFFDDLMLKQVHQELKNRHLEFHETAQEQLYAFVHKDHPLAGRDFLSSDDLIAYPCVTYDRILQSTPLTGEMISSYPRKIGTNDRAVAYSLLRSTNAFLTGSSYHVQDPCYSDIIAIPTQGNSSIHVGWVVREEYKPSDLALQFIDQLPHI